MSDQLRAVIEHAWEARDSVSAGTKGEIRQAVDAAIAALDRTSTQRVINCCLRIGVA